MGGKHYDDARTPRAAYLAAEARIKQQAQDHFGLVSIPKHLGDKADYGDLDLLVIKSELTPERLQAFGASLRQGAEDVKHQKNHDMESYRAPLSAHEVELARQSGAAEIPTHLQVDLFPCEDELDMRKRLEFMNWGDFSAILGKMLIPLNLQWSTRGLEYIYRFKHIKRLIPVSELSLALHIAELDADRYQSGFSTEGEMFAFIMESPLLDHQQWIKPGSKAEKHGSKRPSMGRFIEMLKARHAEQNEQNQQVQHPDLTFDELLEKISCFEDPGKTLIKEARRGEQIASELREEVKSLDHKYAMIQALSEEFSGKAVTEIWPELCAQGLGMYLKRFTRHIQEQLQEQREALETEDARRANGQGAETHNPLFDWISSIKRDEARQTLRNFEPNNEEREASKRYLDQLLSGNAAQQAGKKAAKKSRARSKEAGHDHEETERLAQEAFEQAMQAFTAKVQERSGRALKAPD